MQEPRSSEAMAANGYRIDKIQEIQRVRLVGGIRPSRLVDGAAAAARLASRNAAASLVRESERGANHTR
jgi:hypothetical protein